MVGRIKIEARPLAGDDSPATIAVPSRNWVRSIGVFVMDRPVLWMVSNEPKTSGAMGMLLADWGFRTTTGVATLDGNERPLAAVVDLTEVGNDDLLLRVQERRQALGGHLPVLILADTQPVPPDWSGTDHVTVMAKPVDPARIQAWLATVRSQ